MNATINPSSPDFEFIFRQSPQPMYMYDVMDLKLMDANRAALKMYQYTIEEFKGLSIFNLIAPGFTDRFKREVLPVLTESGEVRMESRHVTKGGEVLIVDVSSHVGTLNGKRIRLVYVHDVTQKVRQAEQLKILNSIGSFISEELSISVILQKVTDETTKLCNADFGAFFYNTTNESGEAMMLYALSGAPKEAFEKLGMPRHTSIFHPTFNDKQVVRVADVTKDPRYGLSPPHFGMPEGHLPVVSYMGIPVISKRNTVIGSLLFANRKANAFTEEAERLVLGVAAQAAIVLDNAKLFEEVKELNTKKDEFLSVASHELKTPITSMKGYLQILEKLSSKEENSPYQEYLKKASLQVGKLQKLVNELLDVSMIESGQLRYAMEKFSVNELLEDCTLFSRTESQVHPIEILGDTQAEIVADRRRMEQVVCNLISNAIKYSPEGKGITVRTTISQGQLLVEVNDQGKGIAKEVVPFIFDRYYRGEKESYSSSGLGLGLYISREIVKRHGGEMGVRTELGKGSTFWFTIPVTQAQ